MREFITCCASQSWPDVFLDRRLMVILCSGPNQSCLGPSFGIDVAVAIHDDEQVFSSPGHSDRTR